MAQQSNKDVTVTLRAEGAAQTSAEIQKITAALDAAQTELDQLAISERNARQESQQAQAARRQARDDLTRLTQGLTPLVRGTEEYAIAERQARQAILDSRTAHEAANDRLRAVVATRGAATRAVSEHRQALAQQVTAERQAAQSTQATSSALDGTLRTVKTMTAGWLGLQGAMRAGRAMIDAGDEVSRLTTALSTIYGSAEGAARGVSFLNRTADDARQSVSSLIPGFTQLSGAMVGAGHSAGEVEEVFSAITKAGAGLGLTSDQVSRAITAAGQMASKTVVSMEEWRQQLSDAIPNASAVTAKALGITVTELNDLIESGRLAAKDVLPALARGLREVEGQNNTVAGAWTRVENATRKAWAAAADAGGAKAAVQAADLAVDGINTFGIGAARTTIALQGLWNAAKAGATGQGLYAMRQALGQAAAQADALTKRTTDVTEATTAAATAAVSSGPSWVSVQRAYTDASKASAEAAVNAKRLAEAKEFEGKATVAMAGLSGSEVARLNAEAQASMANASARGELLRIESEALAAAKQQLATLREMDPTRAKELAGLESEIEKRSAVVEALRQQVTMLETEASSRQLAAVRLADHSHALDGLAVSVEGLQRALAELEERERNGVVVGEQKAAVTRALSFAEGLYRDAVADSARLTAANSAAKQADLRLDIAKLEARQTEATAAAAALRAMGDEGRAIWATIDGKRAQIAVVNAKASADAAAAEADIAAAERQRAELTRTGELTAELEAQIDASIRAARAAMVRAQASKAVTAQYEAEITALMRLKNAGKPSTPAGASGAPGGPSGSAGGSGSVRPDGTLRGLAPGAVSGASMGLQPNDYGYTRDGFAAGRDGAAAGSFTSTLSVGRASDVLARVARGQPVSVAEAEAGLQEALAAQSWHQGVQPGARGLRASADIDGMVLGLKNALSAAQSNERNAASREATRAETGKTVTINLTGGGRTAALRGTPGDAEALEAMLRTLEAGKRSAA